MHSCTTKRKSAKPISIRCISKCLVLFNRLVLTLGVVASPPARAEMVETAESQETGLSTRLHIAMTKVHKGETRAHLNVVGEEVR